MDAIGEQQLKRRAAAEVDAIGAAAEADANGEQQLKRIDAIGEQQLDLHRELSSAGLLP